MRKGSTRWCSGLKAHPKPSLRKERGEVGLRHAFLAVRVGARVFEKRVFFSKRLSQMVVVSAPLG